MEIRPYIFNAKVMHKRIFPKVNKFSYLIYYLVLPLSQLDDKQLNENLKIDKAGIISFHQKDHGDKKGSNYDWITNILGKYNINHNIKEIFLITMPRVLGYVFNPVSFWVVVDEECNIKAVLYEVNNTFGQSHSYLCYHENNQQIKKDDIMEAKKVFHVSPFLKREGGYKFRFAWQGDNLGMWIDFYNDDSKKQLITSLTGKTIPLTKKNLRIASLKHPLITFKAIFLIHWQALKIVIKGIKYIAKPKQILPNITKNDNLN